MNNCFGFQLFTSLYFIHTFILLRLKNSSELMLLYLKPRPQWEKGRNVVILTYKYQVGAAHGVARRKYLMN